MRAHGILPWKTTDGGKNWHNIKKGMIDDSDVFSIIVDPEKPQFVYASACSGIYKSDNGGRTVPQDSGHSATARRTRVLRQDPEHREVVYAGTTEGLYKTTDGGKTFKRMTGADVIVNDVYVDPSEPESRSAGDGSGRRAGKSRWSRDIRARERGILSTQSRGIAGGQPRSAHESLPAW